MQLGWVDYSREERETIKAIKKDCNRKSFVGSSEPTMS